MPVEPIRPNFGVNDLKTALPKVKSVMPLAFKSGSFFRNEVLGLEDDLLVITGLPSITSIEPSTGYFLGGLEISIIGTNFNDLLGVMIDGVLATNVMVGIDEDLITAVVPAGAAGPVDIVVITAKGRVTVFGGFTYTLITGKFHFNDPIHSSLIPLAGF
jgi:hypothetical protein